MKSLTFTLIAIFLTIGTLTLKGQNYSEEAKLHFSKYLNKNSQLTLITNSLPSIDDCKLIFKGSNAYTYFGYVEDMKKQIPSTEEENESFVDCRIETFTTYDIQTDKGNYAGGMKGVKDKLQETVIFYRVTYLREKDAEFGFSYKYFVNIRGNWVFFPKPWQAFN